MEIVLSTRIVTFPKSLGPKEGIKDLKMIITGTNKLVNIYGLVVNLRERERKRELEREGERKIEVLGESIRNDGIKVSIFLTPSFSDSLRSFQYIIGSRKIERYQMERLRHPS